MTFALESFTKSKLDDVEVLSKKNRKPEEAPGVKLSFSSTVSNHLLSTLDGYLKGFLFTKDKAAEPAVTKRKDNATSTLDGVEAVSDLPNLSGIGKHVKRLRWSEEVTGGLLEMRFATSQLDLDDATAGNFSVQPKEGGSVLLKWTCEAPNASAAEFAKCAAFKSCEVETRYMQREPTQQEIEPKAGKSRVIDASSSAKDLPKDAGEVFAEAHGDGALSKGSGEPAWPFPKGDKPTEAPPQSVTVETSRPGTRTARGRDKTAKALADKATH